MTCRLRHTRRSLGWQTLVSSLIMDHVEFIIQFCSFLYSLLMKKLEITSTCSGSSHVERRMAWKFLEFPANLTGEWESRLTLWNVSGHFFSLVSYSLLRLRWMIWWNERLVSLSMYWEPANIGIFQLAFCFDLNLKSDWISDALIKLFMQKLDQASNFCPTPASRTTTLNATQKYKQKFRWASMLSNLLADETWKKLFHSTLHPI